MSLPAGERGELRAGLFRPTEYGLEKLALRIEGALAGRRHTADGHVLFLSTEEGYLLRAGSGRCPEVGEELQEEGRRYTVEKTGPSPLPNDRRRCAYLERVGPAPLPEA
jgi:hypothetical protein